MQEEHRHFRNCYLWDGSSDSKPQGRVLVLFLRARSLGCLAQSLLICYCQQRKNVHTFLKASDRSVAFPTAKPLKGKANVWKGARIWYTMSLTACQVSAPTVFHGTSFLFCPQDTCYAKQTAKHEATETCLSVLGRSGNSSFDYLWNL